MPGPSSTPSKDALRQLLDGLQTFICEHLALARVEIKEDLRGLGRDLAVGAAGLPLLAVGYLLLMMALAYLLALRLPSWAAFAIVATVNLVAGGILTRSGAQRALRSHVELPSTATEIRRDRQWLAALKEGTRPAGAQMRTTRPAARSQPGAQPSEAKGQLAEGTHA